MQSRDGTLKRSNYKIVKNKDLRVLHNLWIPYLKQVDNLLQPIHACCSVDWEGYLTALECLENASPPRADERVRHEDPEVEVQDFVVVKSEISFTRLFADQTLEPEINVLKYHGGMVWLCQDVAALECLLIKSQHLACVVRQYPNSFPKKLKASEQNKHNQLLGDVVVRMSENSMKLHQSIELYCEGNPFTVKSP